jgi:hypothetical protein
MSSPVNRPRRSQQFARVHGLAVVVATGSDGERDGGQRDDERSSDAYLAEATAFLISAYATLENLSAEPLPDLRAAQLIASVCVKVGEALCALDDFSVTQWIGSGSTAGIGRSSLSQSTWWWCLVNPGLSADRP